MKKYIYDGPVLYFDNYVERHWHAETYAVSERKARSNLTYRYKIQNGYDKTSAINLPGEIKHKDDYIDKAEQISIDQI